jgi:hypothetical protein
MGLYEGRMVGSPQLLLYRKGQGREAKLRLAVNRETRGRCLQLLHQDVEGAAAWGSRGRPKRRASVTRYIDPQ